ncbi:MAG TPA: hypothetical protein VGP94_07980 [Tepidisphaeraceae bacterium]|nr:hypothetical protein [Tepidisphaeraceae bacterium]
MRKSWSETLFDPPPTARLLGTALANDQKQPLQTVRFMKLTPLMRISGVFFCAGKGDSFTKSAKPRRATRQVLQLGLCESGFSFFEARAAELRDVTRASSCLRALRV